MPMVSGGDFNPLSNAISYFAKRGHCDHGGACLRRPRRQASDGSGASGIPPEMIGKLFHKGYLPRRDEGAHLYQGHGSRSLPSRAWWEAHGGVARWRSHTAAAPVLFSSSWCSLPERRSGSDGGSPRWGLPAPDLRW